MADSNSIPAAAQHVIEHYQHLKAAEGRTVRCPYYRNPRSGRERWGLNAFSGKGSPKEIEDELQMIEKLEEKNFASLPEEEIRDIMRKRHLGVECSGFLSHIFDAWLQDRKGQRIFRVLRFPSQNLWSNIAAFLRPFTHIDIETLVHPNNATEYSDWKEIRAGDLIRLRHSGEFLDPTVEIDHALLVTTVEKDAQGNPVRIRYAQSVRERIGEGIKEGLITITDLDLPLKQQQWQEFPETGRTINEERGLLSLHHPLFLK